MIEKKERALTVFGASVKKALRAELSQIMRRHEDRVSSRFVYDLLNARIRNKFGYKKLRPELKYEIWEALCWEFGVFEHEDVPMPEQEVVV